MRPASSLLRSADGRLKLLISNPIDSKALRTAVGDDRQFTCAMPSWPRCLTLMAMHVPDLCRVFWARSLLLVEASARD